MTDNESTYSEFTNRSDRKPRKHRSSHGRSRRHKSQGSAHEAEDGGGEKTVTIRTPPLGENNRDEDVRIDMQDDNWGETNTFISGTTDVTNLSHESLAKFRKDLEASIGFRDFGFIATVILAFLSFISPIAFVVLPVLVDSVGPSDSSCNTPCQGVLISMSFKLLILLVGSWALFFRRPRASMPRVFLFRALVMGLVLIITVTYWLFYGVRILDKTIADNGGVQYQDIVGYAETLTNCLLFIHYLAVILLELRQLQTTYIVEVIRSTDGERKFYNVGELSIQRAAVYVLEQYYRDFPVYNPALLHIPSRSSRMKQISSQNFKVYDVDGPSTDVQANNRAMIAAVARRRDAGHNERYYEEAEYERRIRKRRARLIAATEDAFTHIRRAKEEDSANSKLSSGIMNPEEASQAIFPALARALQKYLRTTRQHQHYNIEDILKHLAFCLKHDMTPKAFLERYVHPGSLITYDQQERDSTSWQLVSDEPLVNTIRDKTVIKLSQPGYSLIVTFRKSPRIRLQEDYVEPNSHRFVLPLQSETSV